MTREERTSRIERDEERRLQGRTRFVLVASLLGLCWIGMQATHEMGHLMGAWASGGRVQRVVLDPLGLSRTDVAPNPHPLIEVWAGPVLGSMLPLAAWWIAAQTGRSWSYLVRFFAGFCLVANGCYLGAGAFFPAGDAAELLALGQPRWVLLLFGFTCASTGFGLWHGQGSHFGIGARAGPVNAAHAQFVLWLTLALLGLELLIFRVL